MQLQSKLKQTLLASKSYYAPHQEFEEVRHASILSITLLSIHCEQRRVAMIMQDDARRMCREHFIAQSMGVRGLDLAV